MGDEFKIAVQKTLKNEGGLSVDKDDPGGITNYGISLKFLQDNKIDIDNNGSINGKDIQDLTIDEAVELYRDYFWNKFKICLIGQGSVADKVFDLAVNVGGVIAIKLLQHAVNQHLNTPIAVDGIIGLNTLKAIAEVGESLVLSQIKDCAIQYYRDVVEKHPKLKRFLSGWTIRALQ